MDSRENLENRERRPDNTPVDIILLGLQKVFDVTKISIIEGLYIENRGGYEVTTTNVRCLPLSAI